MILCSMLLAGLTLAPDAADPACLPLSEGTTEAAPRACGLSRLRPGLAVPDPSLWPALPDSLFVPVDQSVANFGYQAGSILLRLHLCAPTSGRWWLQADYPGLDSLRAQANGTTTGWVGDDIPFAAWAEHIHCPSLPLHLNAGGNLAHLQVIERGGRTIVPLQVRGEERFLDGLESLALSDGFTLGVIATNFLVGLYLLALFRRPAHAWYAVYLGAVGSFLATNRHHAFPLLWPDTASFNAFNQSFFSLVGLGALGLFHVHILELPRHHPHLGRVLRILGSLLVVAGLAMFATPWTHALHRLLYGTNASSLLVLASMAIGLFAMVLRAFHRDTNARALLLVTFPTLLAIAVAFLAEIRPDSGILRHRGILIEMLLALETCGITLILSLAVHKERRRHAEILQRHLDLESSFVDRIAQESDRQIRGTAMDLHDGVGQSIASLRLRLHAELASSAPESVRRMDDEMANLAREVRDTARRMYPPELHDGDLEAALRRLLADVPTRWHRSPDLVPFPEQEAYHLYRSLQEAFRNALHHGRARSIRIFLAPGHIRFEDDGAGIEASPREGLGMRGIRQRMTDIGWTASWTSGSPSGCRLDLVRGPDTLDASIPS